MSIRFLNQAAFVNPDINPKAVPSIHPNTWNADGMVREAWGHIGGGATRKGHITYTSRGLDVGDAQHIFISIIFRQTQSKEKVE